MIDLLNPREKKIANISFGYTDLSVSIDNFGHVVLTQDDDRIWLDEKSLSELIKTLQEIKNANSN